MKGYNGKIGELKGGFFCPIEDDRTYVSGVDDVRGGDSFFDYADYFFDEYEYELFDVDFDVMHSDTMCAEEIAEEIESLINEF